MTFFWRWPIRALWIAAVGLGAGSLIPATARAQTDATAQAFAFVPYAAVYSLAAKEPEIVDPLVFVIAPHAPAATGALGIAHLPGIRNARMSDDPIEPALDADGKPLGFDLQHWFAATGVVELSGGGSTRDRVTTRFTNLVANGRYSLFFARSDARPDVVPLDGSGRANSFTAAPDGTGGIALVSSLALVHPNAILLVFHSDRADGGQRHGELGIYAHVQLAATIPP